MCALPRDNDECSKPADHPDRVALNEKIHKEREEGYNHMTTYACMNWLTLIRAGMDPDFQDLPSSTKDRVGFLIETADDAEDDAQLRGRPAAGQRSERREEQAPQETITTANMDINIPEEQHEA
eukprot:jgi/Tetstr1/457233/TSEL_004163.t1